ncbi:MAG: hypothetical protein LBK54_07200 [Propionibacteriaceae bacterium]|jgi:hypothetical protein|nr:hypothetical protein [Propionibacteriaceae bacterium]
MADITLPTVPTDAASYGYTTLDSSPACHIGHATAEGWRIACRPDPTPDDVEIWTGPDKPDGVPLCRDCERACSIPWDRPISPPEDYQPLPWLDTSTGRLWPSERARQAAQATRRGNKCPQPPEGIPDPAWATHATEWEPSSHRPIWTRSAYAKWGDDAADVGQGWTWDGTRAWPDEPPTLSVRTQPGGDLHLEDARALADHWPQIVAVMEAAQADWQTEQVGSRHA